MQDELLLRYSRQIMLPQIDLDGQERLQSARVLVVGAGGLGSPVAMYLAASGIGALLLCDADVVELSNLQRQIIHSTATLGRAKVDSAKKRLQAINPHVEVIPLQQRFGLETLEQCLEVDVVVDCTDNLASRFAINRACVKAKKPLVSGAAVRWEGQVCAFDSRLADSPCYHCFYGGVDEVGQTCSENGVISPLLGVIGSMQALEVIKLITGAGESLVGRVLLFDALYMEWRNMRLLKNPQCGVCGNFNI